MTLLIQYKYNIWTQSLSLFIWVFNFSQVILLTILMLSRFSHVRLCATLWTAAHQAPLSMGFSRQEYWSGLPFPSPIHACMLSPFSHVWLCVTPWTAAHQVPLSMGFSRQEYWSGLPFPSPMHACMLSCFSCVQLCATPWTAAHQVPLSMGFFRQEHWSGLKLFYQILIYYRIHGTKFNVYHIY